MPTAYRILPAMTTAGRHHRVCVATSRRPHPHILESGLARSPPLPIILCVYTSAHHFRWIRVYAIRLPGNEVLQREIAPLLRRPVGRPPKRPVILYDDFWYRAGSWDRARRVVAKVEWHRGELFPRVGFIVTSMTAGPEGVVRFYNGRGTAEQWIKEGKYALNWTRLSCHRFVANRVRLSLFVLAYNLGDFLRRLCLPKAVRHWSLRSVQVKLIKMGGRLVRHSRWLIFQLSEMSVPRRLFQGVLDRIGRLSPAPS